MKLEGERERERESESIRRNRVPGKGSRILSIRFSDFLQMFRIIGTSMAHQNHKICSIINNTNVKIVSLL